MRPTFHAVAGRFSAQEEGDGKRIYVYGPENFGLHIEVDFDDVDHYAVSAQMHTLLNCLQAIWPHTDFVAEGTVCSCAAGSYNESCLLPQHRVVARAARLRPVMGLGPRSCQEFA